MNTTEEEKKWKAWLQRESDAANKQLLNHIRDRGAYGMKDREAIVHILKKVTINMTHEEYYEAADRLIVAGFQRESCRYCGSSENPHVCPGSKERAMADIDAFHKRGRL